VSEKRGECQTRLVYVWRETGAVRNARPSPRPSGRPPGRGRSGRKMRSDLKAKIARLAVICFRFRYGSRRIKLANSNKFVAQTFRVLSYRLLLGEILWITSSVTFCA